MGNRDNILAGINGGGAGGNSLAWFAPPDTAAPTDASTALPAAWLDAGWITEDGLTGTVSESSTDINGFGSFAPVRTIVTESKQTFDIAFLESNPVSLAVYHRQDLDSITPDATGAFTFDTGPASKVTYSATFELVDGDNLVRAYCPSVEVTDRGDLAITAGEAVTYPVTLTAFPDEDGVAVRWFYVVVGLSTGAAARRSGSKRKASASSGSSS